MKRKLIQLAGKTLVVSLPSKWVKRCNVKKGQEVEVEERGREILIKTQAEPESKRIEFDTRNQNKRVVAWILSSLNKKGYDEIELVYDNPEMLKEIQEVVKNLFVGFVTINQTKTRCVIKCVAKEMSMEFDTTLRRAFLVTLTMGENIVEALTKGDIRSLEGVMELERTNNQLTNFCERLLNKVGHPAAEKVCFYYVIAWNLEKICDDYKYVCECLLELKGKMPTFSKRSLEFIRDTNGFFKEYYELFYKFEAGKLALLPARGKSLLEQGSEILRSKKGHEIVVANILMSQVNKMMDFTASIIAINT